MVVNGRQRIKLSLLNPNFPSMPFLLSYGNSPSALVGWGKISQTAIGVDEPEGQPKGTTEREGLSRLQGLFQVLFEGFFKSLLLRQSPAQSRRTFPGVGKIAWQTISGFLLEMPCTVKVWNR
jgi:hypothetical protein